MRCTQPSCTPPKPPRRLGWWVWECCVCVCSFVCVICVCVCIDVPSQVAHLSRLPGSKVCVSGVCMMCVWCVWCVWCVTQASKVCVSSQFQVNFGWDNVWIIHYGLWWYIIALTPRPPRFKFLVSAVELRDRVKASEVNKFMVKLVDKEHPDQTSAHMVGCKESKSRKLSIVVLESGCQN